MKPGEGAKNNWLHPPSGARREEQEYVTCSSRPSYRLTVLAEPATASLMKTSLLLARPSMDVSSKQFLRSPDSALLLSLLFPFPISIQQRYPPPSEMYTLNIIVNLLIETLLVGLPMLVFRKLVIRRTMPSDLQSSELWDQVRIRFFGYLLPGVVAVFLLALVDAWLESTVERLTVPALEIVSYDGE